MIIDNYVNGKRIIFIGLAAAVCLCSCDVLERKHQAGVAVELNGHYLYQSTLDSLTLGLNSTDSAAVATRFIRQWAEDMLVYDGAQSRRNDAIEKMVNDYRNSLYIQAYEQWLISKRMPKEVNDSILQALYDQLSDRLKLKESIVKGILVVVPNEAPGMDDLRDWLRIANGEQVPVRHEKHKNRTRRNILLKKEPKEEEKSEEEVRSDALDNIEKYAYQNASGYELFTDEWKTTTELQALMPFERNEIDQMLRKDSHIELADSTNTYLLQVTDKYIVGELMPLDYARPQLEEYILTTRQVEFLRNERGRMYDEAIQQGKIVFYEN